MPLVSVGSVARSFGRPPETIRRHVHLLARQGFFAVERDGVTLAPSPAAGQRILQNLRHVHDNTLWLVEELAGWGCLSRRAPKGRAASLEQVLRFGMDLRLLGFETFRGPLGGWTSLVVWNTLSAISVRHVTASRSLSAAFTSRSTPDALRRPVSVRGLCATSGLPYATVWRHMAALEAAGRVGRKGAGYVMLTGQLLDNQVEARVVRYVNDILNRVDRLVGEGLDPAAIPSLYMGGRPALVPVG